jgi:hypothetical protein
MVSRTISGWFPAGVVSAINAEEDKKIGGNVA